MVSAGEQETDYVKMIEGINSATTNPDEEQSELQFEQMWNVIEMNQSLYKRAIQPEKAALDQVIHKYALLCENTHKTAVNLVLAPPELKSGSVVPTPAMESSPSCCQPVINLRESSKQISAFSKGELTPMPVLEAEEETICINHIYYSLPSTEANSNRTGSPHTENVRKSTDLLLLRAERKIRLAVPLFATDPADAAEILSVHLEMLAEYMQSAKNRITGQEVVDVAMEGLLQIKSKIIELAYQIGTFGFIAHRRLLEGERMLPGDAQRVVQSHERVQGKLRQEGGRARTYRTCQLAATLFCISGNHHRAHPRG